MNFKERIELAIAANQTSLLVHCWDEDWIGAEDMDELINALAISEGKVIKWESVGASGTGKKDILVSLE